MPSILENLLGLLLLPLISPFATSIIAVIIMLVVSVFDHTPSRGYYRYNGNDYYYQNSSWYSYDEDNDSWSYADNSDELKSIITDDTENDYQSYDHQGTLFEDTNWYDSGTSDDDSDWDSDSSWSSSDWDSDDSDWGDSSWDSGGSDWDSDW